MSISKIYTPRNIYQIKATLFSIAALALATYIVRSDERIEELEGECVILVLAVGYAIYLWIMFRRTPEEAAFYNVDDAPPEEQIFMSKRFIRLMPIVGAIPSIWTYVDLRSLEDGSSERVSLWGPVATIYEHFGFWPAALFFPAIILFVVVLSIYRIERSKAKIGFRETGSD